MDIKSIIKEILECGRIDIYSHVLIYFDGEYKYRYVSKKEDIFNVINYFKDKGIVIDSIYNYGLDINKQLSEEKPMHIFTEEIAYNNSNLVQKALLFAYRKHKGQSRRDGTEYIVHPIRVANNVAHFVKSDNINKLMTVAYLHDTLEDTDTTYEEIRNIFGEGIADMVLELTNDKELKARIGKTECLKQGILGMNEDSLTVKLCDRLDNVSDLTTSSEEFRQKYLKQTLELIEFMFRCKKLTNTHITIIKEILMQLSSTIHICYSNNIIIEQETGHIESKKLDKDVNDLFRTITFSLVKHT